MKRHIRTSVAHQGFFTAAVVGLLLVAGHPVAQPLEQVQGDSVERISFDRAQPIQINQLSAEPQQAGEYRTSQTAQRWVF